MQLGIKLDTSEPRTRSWTKKELTCQKWVLWKCRGNLTGNVVLIWYFCLLGTRWRWGCIRYTMQKSYGRLCMCVWRGSVLVVLHIMFSLSCDLLQHYDWQIVNDCKSHHNFRFRYDEIEVDKFLYDLFSFDKIRSR